MAGDSSRFFHYIPFLPAAVIFAILFACSTSLTVYETFHTKSRFTIPIIVGGVFEISGYLVRAYEHSETPNWTISPYAAQSLLLLLAPNLFAASVYMTFGRLVRLTKGESLTIIKPQYMTKIFVSGDVISFLIQCGGGGLMASSSASTSKLGSNLTIAGLVLQLLSFCFFVFVAAQFHRLFIRSHNNVVTDTLPKNDFEMQSPLARRQEKEGVEEKQALWLKHQVILYLISTLIVIRATFRVVEFVQGHEGYIMVHEWFLYVFDASVMWGVMVAWNVVFPGEIEVLIRS